MFNEQRMEIVFHTPLSSLMPSWGVVCTFASELARMCVCVCVFACACKPVSVHTHAPRGRWEGRNKEGEERGR